MVTPLRIADETFVLTFSIPVGELGLLPLNPMVIRGTEPILVDTGAPIHRDEYLNAVFSLLEPADVRWIFLSHDDRDHSGNIMQVLDLCPNARVITDLPGVGRLSEEWALPMPRVHLLNDGESLTAGDRTIAAIRPPFYDSPSTRGLWDSRSRVYYGVDSFGAPLPHLCEEVGDVPGDVYENGFNWFNRVNHPWHVLTDPAKVDTQINRIRGLAPDVIVSYHGPVARDRSEQLCDMLAEIPRMAPLVLPSQADLEAMMLAHAGAAEPVAAG